MVQEDDPTLVEPVREFRLPDDALVVGLWSGNDLKERKGTTASKRECDERLKLDSRMACLHRECLKNIFIADHHADLFRMPSDSDIHSANLCVVLDVEVLVVLCASPFAMRTHAQRSANLGRCQCGYHARGLCRRCQAERIVDGGGWHVGRHARRLVGRSGPIDDSRVSVAVRDVTRGATHHDRTPMGGCAHRRAWLIHACAPSEARGLHDSSDQFICRGILPLRQN